MEIFVLALIRWFCSILCQDENNFMCPLSQVGSGSGEKSTGSGRPKITGSDRIRILTTDLNHELCHRTVAGLNLFDEPGHPGSSIFSILNKTRQVIIYLYKRRIVSSCVYGIILCLSSIYFLFWPIKLKIFNEMSEN